MRLILGMAVGPDTVGRLRALSPDLEVIDRGEDPEFDPRALADRVVEVLVGPRPPTDLGRVPRLRWLQVGSAGVDHLTADAPWRKGLIVTNARGVYAVPIAEYVTGMVLRVNQPAVWSRDQAAHRWPADAETSSLVRGQTAVIVGYGSIGREVARQLSGIGMRIVAVKPRPEIRDDVAYRLPGTGDPDGSIPERIVGVDRLAEATPEADVVVLTVPLTDASRGIIDRRILAALRPAAWLINVARGALVDQEAMIDALRAGRLAGAVLDVTDPEPLPADSPLWDLPNVILTPHVSGATMRFFDDLLVENVRRDLAGEPLLNAVDPGRGY